MEQKGQNMSVFRGGFAELFAEILLCGAGETHFGGVSIIYGTCSKRYRQYATCSNRYREYATSQGPYRSVLLPGETGINNTIQSLTSQLAKYRYRHYATCSNRYR